MTVTDPRGMHVVVVIRVDLSRPLDNRSDDTPSAHSLCHAAHDVQTDHDGKPLFDDICSCHWKCRIGFVEQRDSPLNQVRTFEMQCLAGDNDPLIQRASVSASGVSARTNCASERRNCRSSLS